jgi:hypothetical protein
MKHVLLENNDFCCTLCNPYGRFTMEFVYVKFYGRSYMLLELRVLHFGTRPTDGNRLDVAIPCRVSSI